METLSLSLKFATEIRKEDTLTTLTKIHRFDHRNFKKSFFPWYHSSYPQQYQRNNTTQEIPAGTKKKTIYD